MTNDRQKRWDAFQEEMLSNVTEDDLRHALDEVKRFESMTEKERRQHDRRSRKRTLAIQRKVLGEPGPLRGTGLSLLGSILGLTASAPFGPVIAVEENLFAPLLIGLILVVVLFFRRRPRLVWFCGGIAIGLYAGLVEFGAALTAR